ncbi:hypothetical protein ACFVH7_24340 [Kitasatospora indigofera]|uniref:hypothetical protein n=1 Tax=Kitasatospora indigofera TaxID=67307 RepID=UPI0036378642
MGSTIALLEAQLPAARERRGRLEEELAAAVARESAITSVLEGLRALSGTHLDGRAEPRDAVEAPVPDPAPDLALGPDGAAETVTSTSSVQATAADASADGPAQDPAQDPADPAPVSAEPVAQPTARPARRTTGRSTATRAAAKRTTAAKRSTAGRKASAGGKTTAGTAAPVPATSAAIESQPGEVPAVVTVAKKRTRRSAPKAVPDAAPNDAGPGTVKRAAASAKKAAPAKAASRKATSRKAAPAKPVAKKVAPKKAVPATEAAPATVDAPAAATAAPVDAGPAKAASAPGRRRLADAEGVLAVLAQAQNPLRAREVAGLLGLDGAETTVNAIRTRLERLAKSGHAQRPGRGLYTVAADRPGTAG